MLFFTFYSKYQNMFCAYHTKGVLRMDGDIKKIQSVQRALDIINCVANSNSRITLKEITELLGLNINTARGLAQTLVLNGYLAKDVERGTYSLGYQFYTKSTQLYEFQLKSIRDASYAEMLNIAKKFKATTCLQISFYSDIYTLETVVPPQSPYAYVPNSATNLPLHASASGKLLIAHMSPKEQKKLIENSDLQALTQYTITKKEELWNCIKEITRQGYAVELSELSVGIGSIAVPIFDLRGTLRATISLVGSTEMLRSNLNRMVAELQRAGERITNKISYPNTTLHKFQ